jgi:hypothetical protein
VQKVEPDTQYESPEAAFEALLIDRGVKSFHKWETAMVCNCTVSIMCSSFFLSQDGSVCVQGLIVHDKRYTVLKTVEDKKRVFRQFQDSLAEREQAEEKQKAQKVRIKNICHELCLKKKYLYSCWLFRVATTFVPCSPSMPTKLPPNRVFARYFLFSFLLFLF